MVAEHMRYSESRKERTRLRVLGEAAAAIRTKGAERVSVAEVMAAAGLTHGGFYAHFDSKDDLVAQAITHMFDTAFGRFLSLTEGREPAAAIASHVDF
jgi:TetR/AcrR family transcriptional repressor of nem operon